MATFILNSKVTIAGYKPFIGMAELTIKKSIRNFVDTALLTIPASSVLVNKKEGEQSLRSVATAAQFKRGDKISIELGYNGTLRQEFEGFILRVGKSTPCTIECEGYAYQLRGKQVNKVWKQANLKDVLKEIVTGTDIVLSGDIDEILVDRIELIKMSAFQALGELSKQLKGAVAFYFTGNVLSAGLVFGSLSQKNKGFAPDVGYRIGHNTLRDDQMKERIAGDNAYEVELVFAEPGGKKKITKVGVPNSNSVRQRVQAIRDEGWRKKMASELEQQRNYEGYDGKITAFLVPYCHPGQKMQLQDLRYNERSGNYLIEETEVKYGRSGARRVVKMSIKL